MAQRTPRFRTNYIPVCIFNDWYTYFDRSSINREESRQTLQLILARLDASQFTLSAVSGVDVNIPSNDQLSANIESRTGSPRSQDKLLPSRRCDHRITALLKAKLVYDTIFDKGGISTRNDPLGPKFVLILVRSNGMDAA